MLLPPTLWFSWQLLLRAALLLAQPSGESVVFAAFKRLPFVVRFALAVIALFGVVIAQHVLFDAL
jgi:hypothetical protein